MILSKTIFSQTYAQTLQLQNLQTTIAQTGTKLHLKGLLAHLYP